MIEYYRHHPEAIDQIRAPMFEDKVIDFILEQAKLNERRVPVSELLKDEDGDEVAASEAKAEGAEIAPEPAADEPAPKKGRGKKR